jgi:hypothetical protein
MGLKKLEKTRLQKALKALPSAPASQKITVTLSGGSTGAPDAEDVHIKTAAGTQVPALKRKICHALDIPETSISRLEYQSVEDSDSSWYALVDEEDLADGLAEQGGQKIVLRVVCVSLPSIVSAVALPPV